MRADAGGGVEVVSCDTCRGFMRTILGPSYVMSGDQHSDVRDCIRVMAERLAALEDSQSSDGISQQ